LLLWFGMLIFGGVRKFRHFDRGVPPILSKMKVNTPGRGFRSTELNQPLGLRPKIPPQ
jgi:hypothetical protein